MSDIKVTADDGQDIIFRREGNKLKAEKKAPEVFTLGMEFPRFRRHQTGHVPTFSKACGLTPPRWL